MEGSQRLNVLTVKWAPRQLAEMLPTTPDKTQPTRGHASRLDVNDVQPAATRAQNLSHRPPQTRRGALSQAQVGIGGSCDVRKRRRRTIDWPSITHVVTSPSRPLSRQPTARGRVVCRMLPWPQHCSLRKLVQCTPLKITTKRPTSGQSAGLLPCNTRQEPVEPYPSTTYAPRDFPCCTLSRVRARRKTTHPPRCRRPF